MDKHEISTHLRRAFHGNVVVVGIGNALRADDGFGPELAARLNGITGITCIDAGGVPENHLRHVVSLRPDSIVLADIAHMGLPPGSVDVIDREELLSLGLSTHDIPHSLLIEYLEEETHAPVHVLAVQPETIWLGGTMSDSVRGALVELCQAIKDIRVGI